MPNCQNVRCMKCQNCQNIPHKPLTVTLALLFFFAGREKLEPRQTKPNNFGKRYTSFSNLLRKNIDTSFSNCNCPSCKTFINMTKSKSNTKAADKKKERIELQKRIDARIKFVSEANKQEDPLSVLPSFKVWMLKISWNYCILLLTDFFRYHT